MSVFVFISAKNLFQRRGICSWKIARQSPTFAKFAPSVGELTNKESCVVQRAFYTCIHIILIIINAK